ncbi:hypothetical protein QL285_019432 [Trifolium repens]|nr:hypothetical protein QL285_019432 [Trifolium repens]
MLATWTSHKDHHQFPKQLVVLLVVVPRVVLGFLHRGCGGGGGMTSSTSSSTSSCISTSISVAPSHSTSGAISVASSSSSWLWCRGSYAGSC